MIDVNAPRQPGEIQNGDHVKWRGDGRTGEVVTVGQGQVLVDFGYRTDWCYTSHLTVVTTWQEQLKNFQDLDDWIQDELPFESNQL